MQNVAFNDFTMRRSSIRLSLFYWCCMGASRWLCEFAKLSNLMFRKLPGTYGNPLAASKDRCLLCRFNGTNLRSFFETTMAISKLITAFIANSGKNYRPRWCNRTRSPTKGRVCVVDTCLISKAHSPHEPHTYPLGNSLGGGLWKFLVFFTFWWMDGSIQLTQIEVTFEIGSLENAVRDRRWIILAAKDTCGLFSYRRKWLQSSNQLFITRRDLSHRSGSLRIVNLVTLHTMLNNLHRWFQEDFNRVDFLQNVPLNSSIQSELILKFFIWESHDQCVKVSHCHCHCRWPNKADGDGTSLKNSIFHITSRRQTAKKN